MQKRRRSICNKRMNAQRKHRAVKENTLCISSEQRGASGRLRISEDSPRPGWQTSVDVGGRVHRDQGNFGRRQRLCLALCVLSFTLFTGRCVGVGRGRHRALTDFFRSRVNRTRPLRHFASHLQRLSADSLFPRLGRFQVFDREEQVSLGRC